jgi:hypothetical protein
MLLLSRSSALCAGSAPEAMSTQSSDALRSS